ncbi:MAG: hypothetical protein JO356_05830 [Acidobacteria bacterium]|nr:hypothetical protein [Acidobacteriota bacterium]
MKTLLTAMLIFAIAEGLWAQSDHTEWNSLSQLAPGEQIRLIDRHHNKHSGSFSSFTNESIVVHARIGDDVIARDNVLQISRSRRWRRLHTVVVAGGLGAGVGAIIGYASNSGCTTRPQGGFGSNCVGYVLSKGQSAGLGAALGFLAGAAAGAVVPVRQTIYRAER